MRFSRTSEVDVAAAIKASHLKRIEAIASWVPEQGTPSEQYDELVKVYNRRVKRFAALTAKLLEIKDREEEVAKFKAQHHYLLRVAILERNDHILPLYQRRAASYQQMIAAFAESRLADLERDRAEWEVNKALMKKIVNLPKTAFLASIKTARQSLKDIELATRPD